MRVEEIGFENAFSVVSDKVGDHVCRCALVFDKVKGFTGGRKRRVGGGTAWSKDVRGRT